MPAERYVSARAAGLFVVTNAVVAFSIGLGFIDAPLRRTDTAGRLFLIAATLGQTGALCLLCGFPLLVMSRVRRAARWIGVLGPVLFTALPVFLYIDLIVYEMFRFHINGLAVNLMTTPGGFEAMRLSQSDTIVFAMSCTAGLAAQSALFALLHRRSAGAGARAARTPWLALTAVVLTALVSERAVYGVADLRGDTTLTHLVRPVPLYLPLTFKRVAARWTGIDPAREGSRLVSSTGTGLRYPLEPLEFATPADLPDIVWVVLDSWRSDAFNPEVTPNIHEFGRNSILFDRHIATGNATRFGIFGMFYGLHGVYWHPVLAAQRGPVLVDRLIDLGYRFKVITPSPLTFPEFRRTVFVEVRSQLMDQLPGETLIDRHVQTVETFEAFTEQVARERAAGSDDPFFSFMFFDSTHAPYDFPDDHVPFRPYAGEISYAGRNLEAQREPILNRYRNAISWLDLLTGRVVDALEQADLLEGTIVLITGDHGEEFGEHGLWGHNSAFTDEQIHVPFVLRIPGREHAVIDYATSHQDIAPTFMELLGVENRASDYSNGRSLFDRSSERRIVACGWSECAWIHDDGCVVFGTSGGNSFSLEARDVDYQVRAEGEKVAAERPEALAGLARDLGCFLAD
ncbi:MAG: sulfatase-like hydrolase/transferase [Candidatus Binatia bacterium]